DRNRSHWSTSKTPSYTKSVSWQHHRCIGRNVFMGLLFHINDSYSREYDDRDVRGSITFNNDIYYVNRSGIVRYKNDFYRINKKSFSHIMNQDKSKCPLID
ncbi:hypothetical protein P2Q59_17270, partial [Escherichia coli]